MQFLALTLAAYRVVRFLALDDLPLISTPRRWLTTRAVRFSNPKWAEGLVCPWCVGVWVCLGAVWTANVWMPVRYPWLQALAMMTLCGLIAERLDNG